MAGLPTDKLVECHGHFRTASCVQCKRPAPIESVRKAIVDECQPPLCSFCNDDNPRNKESPSSSSKPNRRLSGRRPVYTKPDIVFFGEDLPPRFHQLLPKDLHKADLCLILGTSLQVPPTAHIPDRVHASCKRVLLNRELVGNLNVKNVSKNPSVVNRDAFYAGDCDDSILWIARILGWELELLERHAHTKKADVRLL